MRIADDGACAKPIRWVCWRPAVPVSQFVEAIWEMEGHWGGVRYIIPKPVVDVVFSLRHESDRAVTENGAETEPGAAWVAGVHQAVRSEMSAAVHRVGVRFRPGMARAFLGGLAVDELIDRRIPLDDILGSDALRTTMRLREAPSERERVLVLESFLLSRLKNAPAPDPALLRAMVVLRDSAGIQPVGPLAQAAGIRRRAMIELFRREAGAAPKTLARILRLHQSLHMLRNCRSGSLGRIAAELGFADQAHFTREFRAMTGQTPGRYRQHTCV
jgi:AraC-like DNA-binding protein